MTEQAMEIVTIEQEAAQALTELTNEYDGLTVTDAESAERAAVALRDIVARRRAVTEWFAPLVEAANKAHKALTVKRAAVLARFEPHEQGIRAELTRYHEACEQARREAAAQALADAQARARDERDAAIAAAEAAGLDEAAERLAERPVLVEVPAVVDAPASVVPGVTFARTVKVIVTDMRALCRAVADGVVPVELVAAQQAKLDARARVLGDAFNVPGCTVEQQSQIRARA